MKYKKSLLDSFLEQRINDNAKELKHTLNETLEMEQNCLEQIRQSISHCKDNIAACEKQIKKCSPASLAILETKKSAFKDNLLIWNTMGHIQMASIEMKEYLKRLSVDGIDEWEQRDVIKSVYTAIYETSKKLVDATLAVPVLTAATRYMKLQKSWLMLLPRFSNLSNVVFRIMTIEYLLMYEKNLLNLESRMLLN